jgi:hypothetical protein
LQQSPPLRRRETWHVATGGWWLVQADIAGRSINDTDGITFKSYWNKGTFDNRANLEEWQEEKLVKIGFPKNVVENDSRKMAFRQARVERNISTMTAEAAKNGTTLPPSGTGRMRPWRVIIADAAACHHHHCQQQYRQQQSSQQAQE